MPGPKSGDIMPVQQEADEKVLKEAIAEENIGRSSVKTHEQMIEESNLDARIDQATS